jgi:hypothetical protein
MTKETGTILLYVGAVGFNVIVQVIVAFMWPNIRSIIAASFACVLLVPWIIVGILRLISGPDPFYVIAFLFVLIRTWYIPFVVCIPALAIGNIRKSDILT